MSEEYEMRIKIQDHPGIRMAGVALHGFHISAAEL